MSSLICSTAEPGKTAEQLGNTLNGSSLTFRLRGTPSAPAFLVGDIYTLNPNTPYACKATRLTFPWLPAVASELGITLTPGEEGLMFGSLVGRPDSLGHRDIYRSTDVPHLNLKAVLLGTGRGHFANLPDSEIDREDYGEANHPIEDYSSMGYEVVTEDLRPGDVLGFVGTRTAHNIISGPLGRLSALTTYAL